MPKVARSTKKSSTPKSTKHNSTDRVVEAMTGTPLANPAPRAHHPSLNVVAPALERVAVALSELSSLVGHEDPEVTRVLLQAVLDVAHAQRNLAAAVSS